MPLEAGADINARGSSSFESYDYEGDTALILCCCYDDKVKVAELLLSRGALLDVLCKSDGRNALLVAARHDNFGIVELLIRAGADTTLRNLNGRNFIDLLKLPWNGECIRDSDLECLNNFVYV
jgi:ankyrin repeat protein